MRDMYICLALFRELEKKTYHGRTQSEHEITCLYFIVSHISRFSWEEYLQCRKFLRYAELMSWNVVMTGKSTSSCSQNALLSGHRVYLWYSDFFVLVKRNSVSCVAQYLTRGNRRWWEFIGRFSPYRAQFPRKSNKLLLTAPIVLPNWCDSVGKSCTPTLREGWQHLTPSIIKF